MEESGSAGGHRTQAVEHQGGDLQSSLLREEITPVDLALLTAKRDVDKEVVLLGWDLAKSKTQEEIVDYAMAIINSGKYDDLDHLMVPGLFGVLRLEDPTECILKNIEFWEDFEGKIREHPGHEELCDAIAAALGELT